MTRDGRADSGWHAAGLTSFVGREEILNDVIALLKRIRLLTMVGPGGVGKTRLAVELVSRTEHEVSVAHLAEVDTTNALHREIIRAAGIVDQSSRDPIDVLVDHLRDGRHLLILDNCEHLWDDVRELAEILLAEVPGIRLLTTSRRQLDLVGEHVFRVEPLGVRPPESDTCHESDAMTLLRDRAAAAGRPVDVDDPAVRELVDWSGGLPLVLELVAVRIGGGMAPEMIAQRLDGGRLLVGKMGTSRARGHHRTLQQVLDWSHDLCSPGERRLWARISVFAGGFTMNAAEETCADSDGVISREEIVDLLDGLVRQSLVTTNGRGRYQQLQPLREYGRHRLRELGEELPLRQAHCDFFQRMATESAQRWCGPEETDRLIQASHEMPNYRVALNHCLVTEDRVAAGLAIAIDLTRLRMPFFYSLIGEFSEWFERLLKLASAVPVPVRINAHAMLGWIRLNQGNSPPAKVHLNKCRAMAEQTGDTHLPALYFLDGAYRMLAPEEQNGDLAEAGSLLGQAKELFRTAGPDFSGDRAMASLIQAVTVGLVGERAAVVALTDQCHSEAEADGAGWTLSWSLWTTGLPELRFGKPEIATSRFQQALAFQMAIDDRWGTIWSAEAISWSLAAEAATGERTDAVATAEWAAELQAGAERMQETIGVSIGGLAPFRIQHDLARSRLVDILQQAGYEQAYRRGRALDTQDVLSIALRPQREAAPLYRHVSPDDLSERQRQVAELVAQGLRNQQIAETMALSVRTVENHLSGILAKLGATNRVQVASWMATRQRDR